MLLPDCSLRTLLKIQTRALFTVLLWALSGIVLLGGCDIGKFDAKSDPAASEAAVTTVDSINSLAGDVTGLPASNSIVTVGGVTAANVAKGATAANAATSANVAGNIVLRDSTTGGFSAGPIAANLTGNVTGNLNGNVTGNVTGSLNGNVTGNVTGNLNGNVTGDVTGNLSGNVTGNVTGNLSGNVTGNVTGNVSGSAGSASYALGQQGTTLSVSGLGPLSPNFSQGNFFTVNLTGASATITSMSAGPQAGARVTLSFANTCTSVNLCTLEHNSGTSPQLLLSGQGNFNAIGGDLFEFVYNGTDWQEIRRLVTNDSRVRYTIANSAPNPGQSIPANTNPVIKFNQQIEDTQQEYQAGTGMFTANQSGTYAITSSVTVNAINWGAGSPFCAVGIVQTPNGGSATVLTDAIFFPAPSSTTAGCAATASYFAQLSAGDKINIGFAINQGSDSTINNALNSFNTLSIVRMH